MRIIHSTGTQTPSQSGAPDSRRRRVIATASLLVLLPLLVIGGSSAATASSISQHRVADTVNAVAAPQAITCPAAISTGLVYAKPYSGTKTLGTAFTCGGHTGQDFKNGGVAFNVLSVQSGTVTETHSTVTNCWGKYVVVNHFDGIYSAYAHLASISVSVGQVVPKGGNLGVAGQTTDGSCGVTGIHLHLSMSNHWTGFTSGTLFDPKKFLLAHGVTTW
jgi:murein DD-endopeptidase MepM/ murein hydrolase activator NlpD